MSAPAARPGSESGAPDGSADESADERTDGSAEAAGSPVRIRGAGVLRAHFETWRPYTLAYPGLVGLTGAALSGGTAGEAVLGGGAGAGRLLVAWGAPTLGWVSGHYLGDWFDRGLDAVSKPQRPLPSGRLSPRAAVMCGAGCAAAAAVAAAYANWRTVLLVAVAMLGIVAYSRLLKGRGLTGNAVRGALTATTVVFGAMTVTELPSWQVLVFAGVFWAQDTASNLVGTLRDVEGDRRGGFRTVPVRHGMRAAVRTAVLLHLAALATATPTLLLATPRPGDALAPLLCAATCGAAAFLPLLRGTSATGHATLTPEGALRAHEVLVAQRMLLAGALLAAGWTLAPALAVVVPLLAVSLYAQVRMRSRHEFPGTDAAVAAGSAGTHEIRGDVRSC